jgi:5-methylcytosine-specific restriction endonuclease McrA
VDRDRLKRLTEDGKTVSEIGVTLGAHPRTIAAWLREYGLATTPSRTASSERKQRHCPRHGLTAFAGRPDGGWRCVKCRSEAVTRRRKRVKEVLVAEAGGACALCGYSRCLAALEFHHLDPASKRFSVAARGLTRSLADAREEAEKCVLLCSNCHAEVEAGVRPLQANQVPGDHLVDRIPG